MGRNIVRCSAPGEAHFYSYYSTKGSASCINNFNPPYVIALPPITALHTLPIRNGYRPHGTAVREGPAGVHLSAAGRYS